MIGMKGKKPMKKVAKNKNKKKNNKKKVIKL